MTAQVKKRFDCIKMKRAIQAKLYRRWKNRDSAEIADDISKHMAQSTDPLAIWWRKIPTAAERASKQAKEAPRKKK
jgi:hypothetical protein